MDVSDSSHSGIVAGKRGPRVGLVGQEAKRGMFRADMDSLVKLSRLKVGLGTLVGEDRGGVTGALFDIRRGGREEGIALRRKAKGCGDTLVASPCVGLGQEDDIGLGW